MNKGGIGLILAGLAALILLKGGNSKPEPDGEPGEAFNNADMTPTTGDSVFRGNSPEQNVKAFLYMLQASEHAYPQDVNNGIAYSTFYGGSRFYDFTDHPVNTGEKKGVRLSDAQCRASGFAPGCVSTAAGAYQFIRPTWDRIRAISPRLPDFSPPSQDEAAIRLLDSIGALKLIQAGDIEAAIAKSSKTWASLPGSKAQQNPRQMAFVIDRFNEGLA
ncbi:MAG: endolysin [Actinobacteria bacterium]|nr:endolysin [Actinomycetota bacterium]